MIDTTSTANVRYEYGMTAFDATHAAIAETREPPPILSSDGAYDDPDVKRVLIEPGDP